MKYRVIVSENLNGGCHGVHVHDIESESLEHAIATTILRYWHPDEDILATVGDDGSAAFPPDDELFPDAVMSLEDIIEIAGDKKAVMQITLVAAFKATASNTKYGVKPEVLTAE